MKDGDNLDAFFSKRIANYIRKLAKQRLTDIAIGNRMHFRRTNNAVEGLLQSRQKLIA